MDRECTRVPRHTRSSGWVRPVVAVCALGLAASIAARVAVAQVADTTEQLRQTARDQGDLYVAPESPAFTFLGISPTTVNRPTTSRELGLSLANAVDSSGHTVQGFAVEFVPAFFVSRFSADISHYRHDFATRLLSSAQFSLGTGKAGGDSGSTDVSLGVRMVLRDEGDPMMNAAYTHDLAQALRIDLPDVPGGGGTGIPDAVRERARAMRTKWSKEHWNSRRTVFAAATGLRFLKSDFRDSRGLGAGVWIVDGEPLGDWGQFLLHLQYDYRRSVGSATKDQRLTYGSRVNIGGAAMNGFLELAGVNDLERGSDPAGRWTGGVEFRLASGLWASTGLGSAFGPTGTDERVLVIANVRWAIADKSRLSPK